MEHTERNRAKKTNNTTTTPETHNYTINRQKVDEVKSVEVVASCVIQSNKLNNISTEKKSHKYTHTLAKQLHNHRDMINNHKQHKREKGTRTNLRILANSTNEHSQ